MREKEEKEEKEGERERGESQGPPPLDASAIHAIKHFALSPVPAFVMCLRFRDSEPRLFFKTTCSCTYDRSLSENFLRSVFVYYHYLTLFIFD